MGDATSEALSGLHPPGAVPRAAAHPGQPYQVTAEGLRCVLYALPRGSATGLRHGDSGSGA
jgi:hypothetical protein